MKVNNYSDNWRWFKQTYISLININHRQKKIGGNKQFNAVKHHIDPKDDRPNKTCIICASIWHCYIDDARILPSFTVSKIDDFHYPFLQIVSVNPM